MRNYIAVGAFAFATSLLLGCANEPPKCSDHATLALAKTIVCKQILVAVVDPDCKAGSLQHARPLRYDAAIKKLTCTANLVIPVAGVAGVNTPMKYESQIDEQGQQVVAVYELSEDGQNELVAAMSRLDFSRQAKAYEERDRLREAQADKERAAVQRPPVASALGTTGGDNPPSASLVSETLSGTFEVRTTTSEFCVKEKAQDKCYAFGTQSDVAKIMFAACKYDDTCAVTGQFDHEKAQLSSVQKATNLKP